MTLALAFIGRDGIVMATDSANAIINASKVTSVIPVRKLYRLGDYTGLAVMSQQAGVSEWMIRQFEPTMKEHGVDISKLSYDKTVDWFTHYAKDYLGIYAKDVGADLLRSRVTMIAFILCGYDAQGEASVIQSISNNVPNIFAPDFLSDTRCYLGMREETMYWIRKVEEAGIDTTKLSVAVLKRLCSFLIHDTADRYPDVVQEPMQMLTITKVDGVRMVTDRESSILTDNVRGMSLVDRVSQMLTMGEI